MSQKRKQVEPNLSDLEALNRIAERLNRAVDSVSAMQGALEQLLDILGLYTGWVFLRNPANHETRFGTGYQLIASVNMPPALNIATSEAWNDGCECQSLCEGHALTEAYTEVRCSRLEAVQGDKQGLQVHASTPLRSGDEVLGILNIAAQDWREFTPRSLALLTTVGDQFGTALERASHYDSLRKQRHDEQATLLAFSNQLLTQSSLSNLTEFLVKEVSRLLRVDACALLLPNEDRDQLMFHAVTGWKNDPIGAGHTIPFDPRSGPGLVMGTLEPLVVEDLLESDPTPWSPEWVRSENFRGHAIVPLVVEGNSIGVLMLDARQKRSKDEDELRFLQLMANQGAIAVESARLREQELARYRLEQELALGRQIQLSLLPETLPSMNGWDFAVSFRAAQQVSGDFYDFFELPGDGHRLGLVIADVAGKGVPAALIMAMSRTIIRGTGLSGRPPATVLKRSNELILKDSRTDLFLSAFFAHLDMDRGRLTYANAGHNPPIYGSARQKAVEELTSSGAILGSFESITLEEKSIKLKQDDLLVLYTDGVTEAFNQDYEPFGVERLKETIQSLNVTSAEQILAGILSAVEAHTGDTPRSDDLTILVLKRLTPSE
jgi:serine phosphatase RsbU (regulator of sigma subunit)